ncbi:hypothetical protein, partial [Actinobacillus pleuropneumoniae]
KTKHIDVRYYFPRHLIDGGKVAFKKVHTRENCADINETSYSREDAMVFRFYWLAVAMMNGHGQGIRKTIVKVEFVDI